jgi:hypothetical protein
MSGPLLLLLPLFLNISRRRRRRLPSPDPSTSIYNISRPPPKQTPYSAPMTMVSLAGFTALSAGLLLISSFLRAQGIYACVLLFDPVVNYMHMSVVNEIP